MDYLNDTDLFYEIKLSQGKGFLTKKGQEMLLLLADRFMYTKQGRYNTSADYWDCYQQGVLNLLTKWKLFNCDKYDHAFPYVTEIMKRGSTSGFNEIYAIKKNVKLNTTSIDAWSF